MEYCLCLKNALPSLFNSTAILQFIHLFWTCTRTQNNYSPYPWFSFRSSPPPHHERHIAAATNEKYTQHNHTYIHTATTPIIECLTTEMDIHINHKLAFATLSNFLAIMTSSIRTSTTFAINFSSCCSFSTTVTRKVNRSDGKRRSIAVGATYAFLEGKGYARTQIMFVCNQNAIWQLTYIHTDIHRDIHSSAPTHLGDQFSYSTVQSTFALALLRREEAPSPAFRYCCGSQHAFQHSTRRKTLREQPPPQLQPTTAFTVIRSFIIIQSCFTHTFSGNKRAITWCS